MSTIGFVGCDGKTESSSLPGDSTYVVTATELAGTSCSYVPEHHEFDFVWSFKADTFVVEGEDIAPDLIETLVGPDTTTKRIEGTWSIENREIELVVETGDENEKPRTSKLPIYSTGVIRIETPERQYVMSAKRDRSGLPQ